MEKNANMEKKKTIENMKGRSRQIKCNFKVTNKFIALKGERKAQRILED